MWTNQMNLTWFSQHPLGEKEQMMIWFYQWANRGLEMFTILKAYMASSSA